MVLQFFSIIRREDKMAKVIVTTGSYIFRHPTNSDIKQPVVHKQFTTVEDWVTQTALFKSLSISKRVIIVNGDKSSQLSAQKLTDDTRNLAEQLKVDEEIKEEVVETIGVTGVDIPTMEEDPEEGSVDDMSKSQLKNYLKEAGIEFDNKASVEELRELAKEHQA